MYWRQTHWIETFNVEQDMSSPSTFPHGNPHKHQRGCMMQTEPGLYTQIAEWRGMFLWYHIKSSKTSWQLSGHAIKSQLVPSWFDVTCLKHQLRCMLDSEVLWIKFMPRELIRCCIRVLCSNFMLESYVFDTIMLKELWYRLYCIMFLHPADIRTIIMNNKALTWFIFIGLMLIDPNKIMVDWMCFGKQLAKTACSFSLHNLLQT
jgi:hypothetical protein